MAASFSITRAIALWDRLNSSFWFVPTVMAVAAVTLACQAFAAIARYGITDTDVVVRLAQTISDLEPPVPPATRRAIAALRDQILTAGKASAILANDRSTISDVRGSDALRP